MKRISLALAFAVAASVLSAAAFAQLETRTSNSDGVTVKITPKVLAADAKAWEFAVVLDTHTADLSDDLVKTAVIVDGSGKRIAPASWEGAGPGGHHREGVLRFTPASPAPSVVELQIQRPGESAPRSFRWDVK